jgi:hypothetical protein
MASFFKQSWFAPVASAATNFLFPSLGSAVGGAANSILGGALSDGVANALGSAVVGGGIGALSNGGQGALTGALAGGATSALMGMTGYNQGLSGLLANGSFAAQPGAAVTGGLRDANIAATNGVTGGNAAAAAKEAPNAAGGALGMFGNGKGGISPAVIAGLALAGGLGSSMMGNKAQAQPQTTGPTDPNQTRGLSNVAFNRTYRAPEGDMRQYGMQGGQHRFYDNNQVPVAAAEGGEIRQPRRVNTPTPDSAYGGRRAFWDKKYNRADFIDMGAGYIPNHPSVYGGSADLAQTVSPTQGAARIRDMGALDIIKEALSRDPDAQHKVRGNPNDYPRFTEYADGGRVRGPFDHLDRGIPAEGMQRSESVQREIGRRGMRDNPRPSIMYGLLHPGDASVREAIHGRHADTYKQAGGNAEDYFRRNYARGGVSGPGHGREDAIPAVLSDGEYVIDAETVALLGDGSSKAGAQRLDQMRQQIRKHKGGALSRGQISPDAKPAIAYAKGR